MKSPIQRTFLSLYYQNPLKNKKKTSRAFQTAYFIMNIFIHLAKRFHTDKMLTFKILQTRACLQSLKERGLGLGKLESGCGE